MRTLTRLTLVIAGLVVAGLYLNFGTLSPCGMLRETVRKQDSMAAILPDGLVDAAMSAQFGTLSPGRCIEILMNQNRAQVAQQRPPAPVAVPQAAVQPTSKPQQPFDRAQGEAAAAIADCRERRLRGELPSFVASVQCANPKVFQAFGNANYRYMDLVSLMNARRLQIAERIDRGELTEIQAQAENAKMYSEIVDVERRRDAGR